MLNWWDDIKERFYYKDLYLSKKIRIAWSDDS